ncbi:MAG: hypothetical protein HY917_01375 [Candidatus Diapherotrites archaeon]|nr:hypothetical protein [Candidatus Diapherotrites archaeon]
MQVFSRKGVEVRAGHGPLEAVLRSRLAKQAPGVSARAKHGPLEAVLRSRLAKQAVWVDALSGRDKDVLVTHAHSDHAQPRKANRYFMTPATAALLGKRLDGMSVEVKGFGESFSVNGLKARFLHSGHILGSAQVELVGDARVVVSSDVLGGSPLLVPPLEVPECDVLVVESTFGKPEYVFPSRSQVYEDLIRWVHEVNAAGKVAVLAGHALGKAQELTFLVSNLCGEVPFVSREIFHFNSVYESQGVRLGEYVLLDADCAHARVIIVQLPLLNESLLDLVRERTGRPAVAAVASGWRNPRYRHFVLSDHADFNGLMELVRASGAQKVFTYHGFDAELAFHLRQRLGILARPLAEAEQTDLGAFR